MSPRFARWLAAFFVAGILIGTWVAFHLAT